MRRLSSHGHYLAKAFMHYAFGISINGSPKKVESIARVEIVTFFCRQNLLPLR